MKSFQNLGQELTKTTLENENFGLIDAISAA
jgi:hypothetical protein